MGKQFASGEKFYLAAGTIISWFAVVLQFVLIIANRIMPVFATIIKFFSFFTILTNILVALCFTFLLIKPASRWGKIFARQTVLADIVVYITVVGLVYNLILRHLWDPQGMQRLVDELLHSVNPLMFLIYWLVFVTKNQLKWKDVLPWLIYPLVYLIYALTRGALTSQYSYPFIDANEHGYATVLINSTILFVVFLLLSLLVVGIGKMMSRRSMNKRLP